MASFPAYDTDDDDMVGAIIYNSSHTAKVRAEEAENNKKAEEAKKKKAENAAMVEKFQEGDTTNPSTSTSTTTSMDDTMDSNPPVPRIPYTFPFKLYMLLEKYTSDSSRSSAISWHPDGCSFIIHDINVFMQDVMPRHFKMEKFSSFKHELNAWEFEKYHSHSRWRHQNFVRGNIDGLKLVLWKKVGRLQVGGLLTANEGDDCGPSKSMKDDNMSSLSSQMTDNVQQQHIVENVGYSAVQCSDSIIFLPSKSEELDEVTPKEREEQPSTTDSLAWQQQHQYSDVVLGTEYPPQNACETGVGSIHQSAELFANWSPIAFAAMQLRQQELRTAQLYAYTQRQAAARQCSQPKPNANGCPESLPSHFSRLLTRMLTDDNRHSIEWSSKNGRGLICVHDPTRLQTEVLGRYFRSSKFESFRRNMSNWGFRKSALGRPKGKMGPCVFDRGDDLTADIGSLMLIIRQRKKKYKSGLKSFVA